MTYRKIIFALGIVLFFIFFIYQPTFIWLLERFSAPDSYYSHGFLVPFVAGFLIWLKRDKLKTIDIDSSSFGLPLILLGLVIQFLSAALEVYLISVLSFLILIFGTTLYLFGRKIFKEILFSLLFLIFMIPFPMFIINLISFPMRFAVTKFVVFTLYRLGLPIAHSGFEIVFPNAYLVVDTPCGGLRSLITFLAISSLFAYFFTGSIGKKIFLFTAAIPIAFISNYIRIMLLSLAAFIYGTKFATEGFFHTFSGILVFVIGFMFLFKIKGILYEKI